MQQSSKITSIIFLLTLCITSLFIFFFNLGAHSISPKSDEIIYVRVTQGIVHTGELLNLKHGPAPFYHKPPLKFWLGAIFPSLIGESNLSYRLLDGLLGIFSVIMTCILGAKLFPTKKVALIAPFLLISSLELTIGEHGFRRAVLDGLLVFLTVFSSYLNWKIIDDKQEEKSKLSIILGVIIGLAILTKSIAGLMPLIVFAATLFLVSSSSTLKSRVWLLTLTTSVSFFVSSLFYIPLLMSSVKAQKVIVGSEIITRVMKGYSGHNPDEPFFYLQYIFTKSGVAPTGFLIIALFVLASRFKNDRELQFLTYWACVPVLLFSFAASRTPWYISPTVPFFSILTAFGLTELIPKKNSPYKIIIGGIFIMFFILGMRQFHAKYRTIFSVVFSQNHRIPLDVEVERILSNPLGPQVYVVDGAISARSKPINGRFNLYGIYRGMLAHRLIDIKDTSSIPQHCCPRGCVIFSNSGDLPAELGSKRLITKMPSIDVPKGIIYQFEEGC